MQTLTTKVPRASEVGDEQAPWEPDELRGSSRATTTTAATKNQEQPSFALGPINAGALSAIAFYRAEIGPHSVSRCPFVTSCSAFAYDHVQRFGLWGLLPFVDRFFFRENPGLFALYPKTMLPDGRLKYSDDLHHEVDGRHGVWRHGAQP
jgi:Putative membrane protein insertion efficiency factor